MNTTLRKAAYILPPLILLLTAVFLTPVQAHSDSGPAVQSTPVPCGDGYASDQYGFTYDLMQPHWTIGWEGYVSEATINQVDLILDDLNDDQIAQTMILFKPESEVGNRVNCAVHFLRYMRLGLPDGERKDNGFTFLIVVGEDDIDVHYGVGLGLPALTAQGLTPLNRLAEDTFENTGSMDEAYLALIQAYDEYARSKYEPYQVSQPSQAPLASSNTVQFDTSSQTSTSGCIVSCLICVGMLVVLIIIVGILRLIFGSGGSWGSGSSWGGGNKDRSDSRWGSGRSFRMRPPSRPISRPSSGRSGGGSSHRSSSPPRMRGGGGSGRSNRGN